MSKSYGREKPNGTKLCLCFLGNWLLNPTLRTSEPPKNTKRYSVPEIEKNCQYFLANLLAAA
jgi:hypothetical protein